MGTAAWLLLLIGVVLLGLTLSKLAREAEDRAFRPLSAKPATTWPARAGGQALGLLGGNCIRAPALLPDDFVPLPEPGPNPASQPCWVCGRSKSAPNAELHKHADGFCQL
jgi:hypothetical protein